MTILETAQLLGSYGELLGAIAVLITLAFLSVQVRLSRLAMAEQNALARAAAYDQIYEQFKGHRRLIAADPDVARLWLEGLRGAELEEIDGLRFEQLAVDYMIVFSNTAQRGIAIGSREMTETTVQSLSSEIAASPGLARVWNKGFDVHPKFVIAVENVRAAEAQ